MPCFPWRNPEHKDVWNFNNEFLPKDSLSFERRSHGHGGGYHLLKRPTIRYGESMGTQADINMTVHSIAQSKRINSFVFGSNILTMMEVGPCLYNTQK